MEAVEEGTNTEYQAVGHPLAFRLDHTVHLDALIETKNYNSEKLYGEQNVSLSMPYVVIYI